MDESCMKHILDLNSNLRIQIGLNLELEILLWNLFCLIHFWTKNRHSQQPHSNRVVQSNPYQTTDKA